MNGECYEDPWGQGTLRSEGPLHRALWLTLTLSVRIIRNERFMRAVLSVEEENNRVCERRGDSTSSEAMWKSWLVKLGSPHAEIMFGKLDEKGAHHTLKRDADLPGLCLMGQRREASIRLRSRNAFRRVWTRMTDGVLDGLDWENVFVGGGMVMGVLTGSFQSVDVGFYRDSDIE